MTTFRQIEANRCNATKSTGPKTETGKMRSRRNAIRHGLSAETVVEIVEDLEDYRGFEAAVIADYDARTAVERELVLRLASLLWRLRRATAIETDLLRMQAEILKQPRMSRLETKPYPSYNTPSQQHSTLGINRHSRESGLTQITEDPLSYDSCAVISHAPSTRDLSLSFQRLVNLDGAVFERLGRYEAALARQAARCMFFLRSVRYR
jgi:hypothetical protein